MQKTSGAKTSMALTPASPISSQQASRLRQSMELGTGFDLSPGGDFSAAANTDRVDITDLKSGDKRSVRFENLTVRDVTVSDRGDVALIANVQGGPSILARVRPDGSLDEVTRASLCASPELSADGARLTWLGSGSVEEAGPSGVRTVANVPYPAEDCDSLEDGRLLVRTIDRVRPASGRAFPEIELPCYHLVDPQGKVEALTDLATVEALDSRVRESLEAVQADRFPGISPQQCKELVDLFGYRIPQPLDRSPGGSQNLFWVDPGEGGQPFGLFKMEAGAGSPSPALSPADAAAVAGCRAGLVAWQPGESQAAVVLAGPWSRLAIVDIRGGSRLLQGIPSRPVDGDPSPTMAWSPDGRKLAVEMDVQGSRSIYVYDSETGDFFPASLAGRVKGWKDGQVEIREDDQVRLLAPVPLDREDSREFLVGEKATDAGEIRPGVGDVQIGEVRLPVRR